jgi:hypothetical protein
MCVENTLPNCRSSLFLGILIGAVLLWLFMVSFDEVMDRILLFLIALLLVLRMVELRVVAAPMKRSIIME